MGYLPKIKLKFGNFQKIGFFGGQRGIHGFEPSKISFIYDYLTFFEDLRPKNAIFQKFWQLKNVIFKLFGGPEGSPSEKIC